MFDSVLMMLPLLVRVLPVNVPIALPAPPVMVRPLVLALRMLPAITPLLVIGPKLDPDPMYSAVTPRIVPLLLTIPTVPPVIDRPCAPTISPLLTSDPIVPWL